MAQTNYNNALKEVNRLTIEENVRDAEAAIRKAELQTQIALLTDAQSKGKDVSLDLALAQAQLAEADYELANNSDSLTAARNVLRVAEQNLQIATENQQKAIEERNRQLYNDIDLTNQDTDAKNANTDARQKNADAIQKQIDLLRLFLSIERSGGGGMPSPDTDTIPDVTPTPKPDITPTPTVSDESNVSDSALRNVGKDQNINITLEIDGEAIQKVNTRLQEQGKTFLVS